MGRVKGMAEDTGFEIDPRSSQDFQQGQCIHDLTLALNQLKAITKNRDEFGDELAAVIKEVWK